MKYNQIPPPKSGFLMNHQVPPIQSSQIADEVTWSAPAQQPTTLLKSPVALEKPQIDHIIPDCAK